jgi:hypothetical protein
VHADLAVGSRFHCPLHLERDVDRLVELALLLDEPLLDRHLELLHRRVVAGEDVLREQCIEGGLVDGHFARVHLHHVGGAVVEVGHAARARGNEASPQLVDAQGHVVGHMEVDVAHLDLDGPRPGRRRPGATFARSGEDRQEESGEDERPHS